jgi:hypothetical protein
MLTKSMASSAHDNATKWLGSHIGGGVSCISRGRLLQLGQWRARTAGSPLGPAVRGLLEAYRELRHSPPLMQRSDGTTEGLGAELMHFSDPEGLSDCAAQRIEIESSLALMRDELGVIMSLVASGRLSAFWKSTD